MIELLLKNERLDLASLTKTDQSIYHQLPHLLSSHKGRRVILQITHIIREYKDLINQVDYYGKTPLLKFMQFIGESFKSNFDAIHSRI